MNIAIVGAGKVARSLGIGWARAGHRIVLGVRDPLNPEYTQLAEAVSAASVTSIADAVAQADVIVLAVPWDAVPDAIAACGDLGGRLLIDVTNPLKVGPEGLELALGFSTSGGEQVARLAQGAAVFKTMNQVGYAVMADTGDYPVRPVMFVAGNEDTRKPAVLSLVTDLGFEAVDAGPLKQARLLEPYAMLWIDQVTNHGASASNAFAFMTKGTKQ